MTGQASGWRSGWGGTPVHEGPRTGHRLTPAGTAGGELQPHEQRLVENFRRLGLSEADARSAALDDDAQQDGYDALSGIVFGRWSQAEGDRRLQEASGRALRRADAGTQVVEADYDVRSASVFGRPGSR